MTQSNFLNGDAPDPNLKGLLRTGGIAALVMLAIMIIQIIVFIVWPPPSTVEVYFALFEKNWLLGLLSLDLLYILNNTLLILVYLGLYTALRKGNESAALIALVLGLVGIAAYFTSNTVFEMLSLASQNAAATTDTQRILLMTSGQVLLETYRGTAFDVYYVLNAAALLLFTVVMKSSQVFSRVTAYWGLAAGVLMILPSTAGVVGLVFSLLSLAPWAVFSVLVARRLLWLGRQG